MIVLNSNMIVEHWKQVLGYQLADKPYPKKIPYLHQIRQNQSLENVFFSNNHLHTMNVNL